MRDLLEKGILLLDGGLGTTLEDQHGVVFSQDTPLWSSHLLISDPDTLTKVQQDFAKAGADIILTPTYQASHGGFYKTSVTNITDVTNYLVDAVRISKSTKKLVALSLGAYGATLSPSQEYSGDYGDIGEEELKKFHSQRIAEFVSCWNDIDLVAFETLPRLDEVRAVKTMAITKPYWISCVFPNEEYLPDGSSILQLVEELLMEPRPWAIGLNCTKVHKVSKLVLEFERAAAVLGLRLPRLMIYPDGTNGLVYDTTSQKWIGEENDCCDWDEQVANIVQEVQIRNKWEGIVVGGCCKTTPQQIASLRKRLDEVSVKLLDSKL